MRHIHRTAGAAGVALLLALTVATAEAPAQGAGGHTHATPHGGDVMEVANHHVEFKADATGVIQVWLLDDQERTVAPPDGSSVTLIGSGARMGSAGNQVTLPLTVDSASQRLHTAFDVRKFPAFQAVVSITVERKRRNLRFRFSHR